MRCSVTFGNISTLIPTTGYVYHIELDATNNSRLFFSNDDALKITDGVVTSLVAGSTTQYGYYEGVGEEARFHVISGFTQVSDTYVAFVDHDNSCLRWVDRLIRATSLLVGQCGTSGNSDGHNTLFNLPKSIIRDKKSPVHLIVADSGNQCVRRVNFITRISETLVRSGLRNPRAISFDSSGEYLLITCTHYVSKYNIKSQTLCQLTGSSIHGYQDGRLHEARFTFPRELISLSVDLSLVVDTNNQRLRLIDSGNNLVTSICDGEERNVDGTPRTCSLNGPHSLLYGDKLIYIDQNSNM